MTNTERVVLVTGASSGIGAACARLLHARGYRVFGASREIAGAELPAGVERVEMDVDEDASVEAGVAAVMGRAGRIDAVVNAAGYALAGAIEETTIEEARAQLETNLLGAWRVCRAVLPAMRAGGGGTIVNVGSLGGRVGLPFQAAYCASKAALAAFTESLSAEIRPFGIRAVLIEPGNFATAITARRRVARVAGATGAYRERFARALRIYAADEMGAAPPEPVARLVLRILESPSPRLRYTVGPASERLSLAAKALLPGRLFERLLLRRYDAGR